VLVGQTVQSRVDESIMNQVVIKIFEVLAMLEVDGGEALKIAAGIAPGSEVDKRLKRLVALQSQIYRPQPCRDRAPAQPTTPYQDRVVNSGVDGINEMSQKGLLELVVTRFKDMVGAPDNYEELVREFLGEVEVPEQKSVWSGDMGSQMVLRNLLTKSSLAMMSSDKDTRHLGLIVYATVRRTFPKVDELHAFRLNGNNMAWRILWPNMLSGLCQMDRNAFRPDKVIGNGRDHLDYLSQVATVLVLHVLKSMLKDIAPEDMLKKVPGKVGKNGKPKYFDVALMFDLFEQEKEKGGECRQHWVKDALSIILPLLDVDGPGVRYGDAGLLLDVLQHLIPLFNACGKWQYSQFIARQVVKLKEASPRIRAMLFSEICVPVIHGGPLHDLGDVVENNVKRSKSAPTTTQVGMNRHVQSEPLTRRAASAIGTCPSVVHVFADTVL
jgi:hypothetical protein